MNISYDDTAAKWLKRQNISDGRLQEACNSANPTFLPQFANVIGSPSYYWLHWKTDDDIVLCVASVIKSQRNVIRSAFITTAFRLRESLPSGRITPTTPFVELVRHLGRSFGRPMSAHPSVLPQVEYSGPIDPQTIQRVIRESRLPSAEPGFYFLDGTARVARLLVAVSYTKHLQWLRTTKRSPVIARSAVWRSVHEAIADDPSRTRDAGTILDQLCNEFDALLSASGHNENEIHQWLKDERHYVFLHPDTDALWSKLPFGDKESDFVIRHADRTYRLIEIEPATTAMFRRNSEPTAYFNHACQQVRDWQRYIRDNVRTVREELGLEGIDLPRGVVIIGRDEQIIGKEIERKWYDMKSRADPEVYTYDELIRRVRGLGRLLRKSNG